MLNNIGKFFLCPVADETEHDFLSLSVWLDTKEYGDMVGGWEGGEGLCHQEIG